MTNNVLMISVDDMVDINRYRDVAGTSILTPNIDRLMSMGVTFSNAMSPTPVCSPARTSLMTAQSQFTTGVVDNNDKIQDLVDINDTIVGQAHADGFYTWAQGKVMHSGDKQVVMDYAASVLDYQGSGGIIPGRDGDYTDPDTNEPTGVPEEELEDTITAMAAADFINSYDGEDPFFMMAGIKKPHASLNVPQEYYDMYNLDSFDTSALRDVADWEDLPAFFQNVLGYARHIDYQDDDQWAIELQAMYAAISYADAQVGRILDALDESGHWDDTTVVFFSDHGLHLGDHEVFYKFTLWDEAVSIPMVIADPSLDGGTTISTPASLTDVWQTVSGLSGLTAPTDAEGVDLFTDHGRVGVISSTYGSSSIRTEDARFTLYQNGEQELTGDGDPDAMLAMLVEEMQSQHHTEIVLSGEEACGSYIGDTFIVIADGEAHGGQGDDVFFVGEDSKAIGNSGHDTVMVAGDSYKMQGSIEDAEVSWRLHSEIKGNSLDNTITGGWGADVLRGFRGDDHLIGDTDSKKTSSQDLLYGGAGDDTVEGGFGNDTLKGGSGADFLDGGKGDDIISGGRGADTIKGGLGDDVLNGGRGADTFVFKTGHGNDTITDFGRGHDVIDLNGIEPSSIEQVGDDAIITISDETAITVEGVSTHDIHII